MERIKQLIRDTFTLKSNYSELSSKIKTNVEAIQEYFDDNKLKELAVIPDDKSELSLVAKKQERVTVDYDADKLKERLAAELFNEIVVKQYVINDFAGLVALLKASGVSPAEFRKFVTLNQSINKAEVKRLYDSKEITKADIKGCYTANVVKIINITVSKSDE